MATLSVAQINALIIKHGNPPLANRDTAIAIALAESGGNTLAKHAVPGKGIDRGLWQINSFYHPEVSDVQAYDPDAATAAAQQISSNWTNFKPWTTFTSGSYKKKENEVIKGMPVTRGGSSPFAPGGSDIGIPNPIPSVTSGLSSVGDFLGAITNPQLWKRIGIGALAVFLIIVGIFLFSDLDVKDLPAPTPIPV